MSLLRVAARRPLAASCGAPARAFSTTSPRRDDPTKDLLNSILPPGDRERSSWSRSQTQFRPSQQQSRSPVASPPPSGNQHGFAQDLVQQNLMSQDFVASEIDASRLRAELEAQAPRRWQFGDVYAPHDLTGVEAKKWKKSRRTPELDAFDTLGLDPLKEYKNFSIISEYMTEMGRIKHSKVTGLRPRNHRKLAKAIRRAIGIGIMPSVHVHPELIKPSHGAAPGGGSY
ncbi:ribosomal protein S18 [Macrophomina phaseolina]|uniref:Small ribosomal subunit protein bS18m n=1 Tax=Macrophomina phaseolina TaxID=35725 RepID=A0ABQ8GL61_9PEZI|nr:ribosomal protein S18 [Macrophomina phaseolina]